MKGRVVTERERERRRTIVKLWFTKKKNSKKVELSVFVDNAKGQNGGLLLRPHTPSSVVSPRRF